MNHLAQRGRASAQLVLARVVVSQRWRIEALRGVRRIRRLQEQRQLQTVAHEARK